MGIWKIVEMGKIFFSGQPKNNKGQHLGKGAWEDDQKWVLGLTERGHLDAIIKQVPSNRLHSVLMPMIDKLHGWYYFLF